MVRVLLTLVALFVLCHQHNPCFFKNACHRLCTRRLGVGFGIDCLECRGGLLCVGLPSGKYGSSKAGTFGTKLLSSPIDSPEFNKMNASPLGWIFINGAAAESSSRRSSLLSQSNEMPENSSTRAVATFSVTFIRNGAIILS